MIFADIANAEKNLKQNSYYRLSGYWHYFKKTDSEEFRSNTTFEQILLIKQFDDELKLLLLQGLQKIEVNFRTIFAHILSHSCHCSHPHLREDMFDDTSKYHRQYAHLQQTIRNNQYEDFIQHFQARYANDTPPIWACVELMSFGELISWYQNLKPKYKRKISREYNVSAQSLGSFLMNFSITRNKCSHYNRVWKRVNFALAVKYSHIRNDHELKANLLPNSKKPYNTIVLIDYFLRQQDIQHDWLSVLEIFLKTFSCIDKYQDLGWKR